MDKNLRTLLTICSVFGIYLQNPKCGVHNGRHIFSIYIILLMTILLLNCVLGIMKSQITNEFIISWVVSTIVFISQMLTHFIIMYEALTKHKAHTDFLRLLEDIIVYFKIFLKIDIKESTIIEELRLNFIILTVISKISLIVFTLNFLFDYDAGYFWWALPAILAMRFRFIQLIIYVEILKYYILSLNKKLSQVVCFKTENSKQLLDIDYKHLQSIEVIKHIKNIYSSIYEASTLMNEFAQVSLFAGSASHFLDFTCHIYWSLLAMDNLLPLITIISSVATVLPLALLTFKFCCSCQVIKEEVLIFLYITHDLR